MSPAPHTERFAPSPTGPLHLGHAFSTLVAWEAARAAGGRFLLRLEDLDAARVRPEYVDGIFEDLHWLGIAWEEPVMRQSARTGAYAAALARLEESGLTYRCRCTRRDIREAVSAPQEGAEPAAGPDGPVYPGTCRGADVSPDEPHAVRLDMGRAARAVSFTELDGPEAGLVTVTREQLVETVGDVVLCRRDGVAAYHLAVVVDDAAQGVTHVTRGRDLFTATPVHRVLQEVLGCPAPVYRHHRLIRDEAGKRLAKRDDARAIAKYRAEGVTPGDLRRMVGL